MNCPDVLLRNLTRAELLHLAETEASTPLERALLALVVSEGEAWEREQSEEVNRLEAQAEEVSDQASSLARKLRDLADEVDGLG